MHLQQLLTNVAMSEFHSLLDTYLLLYSYKVTISTIYPEPPKEGVEAKKDSDLATG